MARAKYDPLESAKIGSDGQKPKAPAPTFKDVDVSDVDIEVTPPARPVPAKPTKRVPRYRVMANCRFSHDGQIIDVKADTIIDAAGYGGEAGVAKLLVQGLKLEMVQD